MSDDLVASRLTSWVREYVQCVTADELVRLGTGDMPLEVAVHGVLADREYQEACRAFEDDAAIAPLLTVSGGASPILYAPWTRVFLWADQLPMRILAAHGRHPVANAFQVLEADLKVGCGTTAVSRGWWPIKGRVTGRSPVPGYANVP